MLGVYRVASRHANGPFVLLRISLFNALVTRITEYKFLFAVQQFVRNAHISRVGRCGDQRVRQARLGIHTNVGLHPEVPEVALLRLMHLRIAFAVTVLRRRGRCDDRRIHHSAAPHHQPLGGQMLVDILEDGRRQLVVLEQAAKLEQGRCIGGRLPGEVHADEPTDRLAVVERIFDRLIRQTETLLGDVVAPEISLNH